VSASNLNIGLTWGNKKLMFDLLDSLVLSSFDVSIDFLYLAEGSSSVGFDFLVVGLTFSLLPPIMTFLPFVVSACDGRTKIFLPSRLITPFGSI
jgi:hypothetical protein